MKKTLGTVITAIACVAGLAALQLPRLRSLLVSTELDPQVVQAEEALQRDRLRIWRTMPAFGFDNLVADWTFINFLQYFGNSEARQETGYTILPEFFEVIVRRDPYFRLSYQFMSSSVTLFAGQPQETVRLLEMGLAEMSPTFPEDSFWLWRHKAVDELLFLGDIDAAIASLEKNAEWASQSPAPNAERHGASAQRLADFLRQNPDSREVRANSWIMVWGNAINEDVRQYAQSQIEALGYQVIREGNAIRIEDTVNPDA